MQRFLITSALLLMLMLFGTSQVQAQYLYPGFGGYPQYSGYGYPGLGYSNPGYSGYGYPGYGYPGYGYPGYGYPGYGNPGYGYGSQYDYTRSPEYLAYYRRLGYCLKNDCLGGYRGPGYGYGYPGYGGCGYGGYGGYGGGCGYGGYGCGYGGYGCGYRVIARIRIYPGSGGAKAVPVVDQASGHGGFHHVNTAVSRPAYDPGHRASSGYRTSPGYQATSGYRTVPGYRYRF